MSASPVVVARREEAERELAREIAALVRAKPGMVLGLATGDTPTGVYRELARMRREEGLDFSRAVTFNLDEFLDLPADHSGTFRSWTWERVVEPLGIRPENARVPASLVSSDTIDAHCADYERAIREAGGIDLQILGIGRSGHVGFNEPGAGRETRTRAVELDPVTREDAAAAFGGLERVPRRAITMGVATILDARRVRVLAFGRRKAAVVARFLRGAVGADAPATFLRGHPDLRVWLDREAAPESSSQAVET